MADFTRRSVLAGVPVVVAAAALPAVAATPSPLRALYHEWQAGKTLFNTDRRYQAENEAGQALLDAIEEIESRVEEYVPQTPEDFAWKIIFADDDGDMNESTAQHALVDMAYSFVGIARGRWFHRASWGYPAAEPVSEIEQLARQWTAAWAVNCETDDEQDRHGDEVLDPLADRIASLPAANARDMLWKIHVDSRAGDFGIDDEVHAEIAAMLGLDTEAELPRQEV